MRQELVFCDLNSRLMNVQDTRFIRMKSRKDKYNNQTVGAKEEKRKVQLLAL